MPVEKILVEDPDGPLVLEALLPLVKGTVIEVGPKTVASRTPCQ